MGAREQEDVGKVRERKKIVGLVSGAKIGIDQWEETLLTSQCFRLLYSKKSP